MSPTMTEIDVNFTIPNVRDLDDALVQTYAYLKKLGLTEDRYGFTVGVTISDSERIIGADDVLTAIIWEAVVSVKGRVK